MDSMVKRRGLGKKNTAPTVLVGILMLILLLIAAGVILFVVSWMRGAMATPGGMPGLPSSTQPSENVKYEFGSLLPTWTGEDRITVLVLGIDERSQETGPWRTDTMILLTIDPRTLSAGMLSIPRDLWVPIPGYTDNRRINTAHFLGGPELAINTVEYNLGVPIDHYVRVNFQGFVQMVDQIGGIDVYVEQRIDDPTYPDNNYGYEHLVIEPGWHHFDGEMALKYARTRHGSSDFHRARRQQQVLTAILDRVTSLELLPDLARSAPQLYEMVNESVETNLALDQMLAMANIATQVDRSQIRFGVIDESCTNPWVTPTGAQVLIPLRDRMREVVNYVFADVEPTPDGGQNPVPVSEASSPTPTPEVATVAVLNGTTNGGWAGATGDYLKSQGINVTYVDNADRQDYVTTMVILNRDKPLTTAHLVALLGIPESAVTHGSDAASGYDIVVVLGNDYGGPPN